MRKLRKSEVEIRLSETKEIDTEQIVELYRANQWSSAEKPAELKNALLNSHALITAWDKEKLVGLGNAISDGYLVVYYLHLLIHPEYQGIVIGHMIVVMFQNKYYNFHLLMLSAD